MKIFPAICLLVGFMVVSVVRGASLPRPLIPFEVVSITKTNHSSRKPAIAVCVRVDRRGMTNEVLSAVLADKNGKILCETIGGGWTGGDPCVLLCVEELKKGDYEIWIKMNPYQADKIWDTNEADQLGKVVKLRVGDRWVNVISQGPPPPKPKPKKPPAWVLKKIKAQKSPALPPLPDPSTRISPSR